jgi:outer membrane protein assembly factor BamB
MGTEGKLRIKNSKQTIMKTIILLFLFSGFTLAADWPSYQHDNRRSGVTTEQLNAGNLSVFWVFTAKARPQPAWHGKMQRDSWRAISFQADTFDYDKAFNIIAADGMVIFGSSSGNACVALNDETGAEVWRVPVGGAVRVAPAYDGGKVYFGSDDGQVYCVNGDDGGMLWSYRGGVSDVMIPSDHKFISRYPCRTGVLVQSGSAYCGFGLLTWHANSMVALDAVTGAEQHKTTLAGTNYSFEGMLLSDDERLYVTQGRNSPASFSFSSLGLLGKMPGGGGTYATLSAAGSFFHGPAHSGGHRIDHMQESKAATRESTAQHDFVNRIIIDGSNYYALVRDAVQATGGNSWTQGMDQPVTVILGGTTLYVGSRNKITAINAADGTVMKILTVDGSPYSLAIANGKLFASTNTGKIYCFK